MARRWVRALHRHKRMSKSGSIRCLLVFSSLLSLLATKVSTCFQLFPVLSNPPTSFYCSPPFGPSSPVLICRLSTFARVYLLIYKLAWFLAFLLSPRPRLSTLVSTCDRISFLSFLNQPFWACVGSLIEKDMYMESLV